MEMEMEKTVLMMIDDGSHLELQDVCHNVTILKHVCWCGIADLPICASAWFCK